MGDALRYGVIGTGMMGFEHIRNLALLLAQASVDAVVVATPLAIRENRFPFLRKVGDWNRLAELGL